MSLVLIRPALPEGKIADESGGALGAPTDYASWDDWDTADIVDIDLVRQNYGILFDHVNGFINGTDIDPDVAARSLDEATYIADWETTGVEYPTAGHRHSHDGVGSAALADGVLLEATFPAAGWAMFRTPFYFFRSLMMFGKVRQDAASKKMTDTVKHVIALPYNGYLWGGTLIAENTNGACRFLCAPVLLGWENWSATYKSIINPAFSSITVDGTDLDELQIEQPVFSSGLETGIQGGWTQQWVCVALID